MAALRGSREGGGPRAMRSVGQPLPCPARALARPISPVALNGLEALGRLDLAVHDERLHARALRRYLSLRRTGRKEQQRVSLCAHTASCTTTPSDPSAHLQRPALVRLAQPLRLGGPLEAHQVLDWESRGRQGDEGQRPTPTAAGPPPPPPRAPPTCHLAGHQHRAGEHHANQPCTKATE